jgi:alpha-galactosidase
MAGNSSFCNLPRPLLNDALKINDMQKLSSLLIVPLFACLFTCALSAQDLPVSSGWKFRTGDQSDWATANLNDSSWTPIKIGAAWESQGYANYDGFAWYRLHITIPSSIKDKAFLKEALKIDLGMIDDGDEVYLNGFFIGRNAGRPGDIREGALYNAPRSYTLSLQDGRIRWDHDNVIAVRVFDSGGDGGLYEGKYGIGVMDVTDFVQLNTDNPWQFSAGKKISKKITLGSTSEKYDFTGKVQIQVSDPLTGTTVFKQTIGADFARDRPFEYNFTATLPENRAYQVDYHFTEGRTNKQIAAAEATPYILTPAPPAVPRINGPELSGVRPGAPFLYRIPATGERPLSFSATGLPPSLHLDGQTGIITGTLAKAGRYPLKLTVKNKLGSATHAFAILCGDKIGLTPALGWNSWNSWALSVSDEKVRASARAMADKLADHGWAYINIDDGWEDRRDGQGMILPNNKFPDMKGLCDFVHGLGLKIGIYSSPGPRTCGGFLGSWQHEEQDAATWARWGIDYLKYDWCSYGEIASRAPSLDEYKKPYIVMREALDKTGRDILYSLCQYGMGDVWKWGGAIGANSWRTTGDIVDTWSSMSGIGFRQDKCAPYTAPGQFNDPDMLVVGRVGWGPSLHDSRLSPDEQYTHVSLWSLLSAPLLIGADIIHMDNFTLGLLTNDEVLAIDQDALAKPAVRLWEKDGVQVWVKELRDGSKAIGIFNGNEKPAKPTVPFSSIGLPAQLKLRDCWRQQDLGLFRNSFTGQVPVHGVLLLRARAAL